MVVALVVLTWDPNPAKAPNLTDYERGKAWEIHKSLQYRETLPEPQ